MSNARIDQVRESLDVLLPTSVIRHADRQSPRKSAATTRDDGGAAARPNDEYMDVLQDLGL